FGDDEVWTVEVLRPFYRRIKEMSDADFRLILHLDDAPETVEVEGRTVEAATGEIVADADEDGRLDKIRQAAASCRSGEAWKALAAEVGGDEAGWLALIPQTMSAATIDLLRKEARNLKANTPDVEAALNARRREIVGAVQAATP